MAIDFGLALTPGPLPGKIHQWMTNLEAVLPNIEGHIRSLWMTDHFIWDTVPTYEALAVVAFIAAKFPEFDLGTAVLGQSYRNPAYLAKASATLQALSGGRFILGIGAGWKEDEYRAYGYDYPSAKIRLEQLEDALQITRLLWETEGPVSFEGKHYQIKDAYCEPRPDPAPIIMVGGGGKTTMKHAAKYADWWNISDTQLDTFVERMEILRGHCQNIDRDWHSIRKTWFGRMVLGNTEAEARKRGEEKGRAHYDGWALDAAFVGTPDQVIEQLMAFVDVGVDYFMLEVLDIELPEIQQMLTEKIIPHFQ